MAASTLPGMMWQDEDNSDRPALLAADLCGSHSVRPYCIRGALQNFETGCRRTRCGYLWSTMALQLFRPYTDAAASVIVACGSAHKSFAPKASPGVTAPATTSWLSKASIFASAASAVAA